MSIADIHLKVGAAYIGAYLSVATVMALLAAV